MRLVEQSNKTRSGGGPMIRVLYEDNHLLVVDKPAGLATMGVAEDKPSLIKLAKDYVRARYDKPGNVYLGTVSRLDAPVTGVVLFARTSKAARRLTEQFRGRQVQKLYWAIVGGRIDPPEGECEDWIRKSERHRKVHICRPDDPRAQHCLLSYRRLQSVAGQNADLLEVQLHTGRKHQIRVQLAERRRPVLGDYKYGSRREFPAGIALHSRRLVVEHPVRHEPLTVEAPLPSSWRKYGLPQ